MQKIKQYVKNFLNLISKPEMMTLPGNLAYYFVISVVPILTIIAYAASLFNLSTSYITEFLNKSFSEEIVTLIVPMITGVEFNFKFIIFIIIAIYFSSNGARSIIITANTIYGVEEDNLLKRRIKSIFMTMFIVVLFLFVLTVPVFGTKIVELIRNIGNNSNFADNFIKVLLILKGPVSWFIMFVFIKIIYTMAPDKKLSSANVNLGALITTILWTATTYFYSYYVTNFANYKAFYSNLSNIIVLMLWVYILAQEFVWGMAINSKKENEKLEKTANIKIEN